MKTTMLAIGALVACAGFATQAAKADRSFRASTGIMITASPDGTGQVISVDPVVYNPDAGTVLNLSGVVTIFVNDVPVSTDLYIIDVGGSIASGCVPHYCDGFCPDPSQFCQPYHGGVSCGCYINTNRVSSPPLELAAGDVIRAELAALPGSAPEEYPVNDAISMTYTGSCAADFDHDGAAAVPDIFAYLGAWFAQDIRADMDGVPGVAVPDIFYFLSVWFAGCGS